MLYLILLFNAGARILARAYTDLINAYEELLINISDLLKTRKVDIKQFLEEACNDLQPEMVLKEIKNEILNMWHYSKLEKILKRLFQNDKCVSLLFLKYEDKFYEVLNTIKIVDILVCKNLESSLEKKKKSLNFDESFYDDLGVKIEVTDISDQTLEYFQKLWKKVQRQIRLTSADVILEEVKGACIEVNWKVPKGAYNSLVKKIDEFIDSIDSYDIRILWWKGECIYSKSIHATKNSNMVNTLML